jgi:hypothetical protein
MKPIVQKCPSCEAPLDLELDSKGRDTCEFCESKLYICHSTGGVTEESVLFDGVNLSANPNKAGTPTACPQTPMRSVDDFPQPTVAACPQTQRVQDEEARLRLNAARAPLPPPPPPPNLRNPSLFERIS